MSKYLPGAPQSLGSSSAALSPENSVETGSVERNDFLFNHWVTSVQMCSLYQFS